MLFLGFSYRTCVIVMWTKPERGIGGRRRDDAEVISRMESTYGRKGSHECEGNELRSEFAGNE